MEVNVVPDDDGAQIQIVGTIDERGAEELKRRLLDLDFASTKQVVIDFSAVTFIGSAGIGKLLLLYKNLAAHGGKVRIENMSRDIFTMFKVVKLDKVFEISSAT